MQTGGGDADLVKSVLRQEAMSVGEIVETGGVVGRR